MCPAFHFPNFPDMPFAPPQAVAFARNGYRLAKPQGKPNFTIARKRPRHRRFLDSVPPGPAARVYSRFIAILKLPFKFDRP